MPLFRQLTKNVSEDVKKIDEFVTFKIVYQDYETHTPTEFIIKGGDYVFQADYPQLYNKENYFPTQKCIVYP